MFLGAIAVLLATAASAAAQTNDDTFPQFQWNFSTPGARANAMGRAFIGMADDATATVSNPAGLVNLTRPQLYLEYKNTNLKVDRLAAVDSLQTKKPTTFSTDLNSLSFFSASMPIGQAKRIAIGFTYQQFLDYKESYNLQPRPIPGDSQRSAFRPVTGSADFTGVSYGVTVAAMASRMLDLGVTILGNTLNANSVATRDGINFGPTYLSGNLTDLSGTSIIANKEQIGEKKSAVSFGFGALLKPSDKFSIGVNYVKGPKFTVNENLLTNSGFPNTNQALATFIPSSIVPAFPRAVHLNVPNRFGVGLAARPSPRWTFAFDAVHIDYSSLSDNFTLIFNDTFTLANGTTVPELTGKEYSIPNVTETHFGAEFNLLTGSNPLFIRGGFFTNPDHTVRFNGFSSSTLPATEVSDVNASENATYNTLPRKTDVRGTIGAGIALGLQMQLDLAYVFGKEFIASAAYRFR
jgi:long-subunit fatty acid transport protein